MEKGIISLDDLKNEVSLMKCSDEFPFKKALSEDNISIIAESNDATSYMRSKSMKLIKLMIILLK